MGGNPLGFRGANIFNIHQCDWVGFNSTELNAVHNMYILLGAKPPYSLYYLRPQPMAIKEQGDLG